MGLFDSLKKAGATKSSAAIAATLPEPSTARPQASASAGQPASSAPQSGALPANSSTRRVLFVSGDAMWLDQIERELASLQPNWSCTRADDGTQAVAKWAAGSFDTLILDEKIADGVKLLKSLETELAHGICLVVCQTVDRSTATLWKGTGATLVTADSDAEVLSSHIKRAIRIQGWMADTAIKQLVSQIRKLPTQSRLHDQVSEELKSENGSMDVIGRLIAQEPIISAKVLQVVNSAFFGLTREISDPTESVMVLGSERIKVLILLAGIFSQYSSSKCPGFAPEPVWSHSLEVGTFAWAIALGETKKTKIAEAAFTAGLLHDIGKLVLAENLPSMYDTAMRLKASKKITDRAAEQEILGTTHAELGACLLATWGLPLPILEAIAWHHEPARSHQKGFSLLAAVHAANVFSKENKAGDAPRDPIDIVYFLNAGLGDCRNRWRDYCGLETKPQQGKTEAELEESRAHQAN